MFCPYCRKRGVDNLSVCPQCGKSLENIDTASDVECRYCSRNNPKDAAFCWFCGTAFEEMVVTESTESKGSNEQKNVKLTSDKIGSKYVRSSVSSSGKKSPNMAIFGCLGCFGLIVMILIIGGLSQLFNSSENSQPQEIRGIDNGIDLKKYITAAREAHRSINKDEGIMIFADKDPVEMNKWKVVWEVGSGWFKLERVEKEALLSAEYIGVLKHTTGSDESNVPELILVDKHGKRVGYVAAYNIIVY